ncbi:hypothetical protein G6F37_009726 [Rhizopus arrhizus]|nr:hypothetical protein G6F38_009760 [Rhizopus arrhizus]KAG1154137.1 hypothetical protein G6F37_009726 [Rhizopus arrhizus]
MFTGIAVLVDILLLNTQKSTDRVDPDEVQKISSSTNAISQVNPPTVSNAMKRKRSLQNESGDNPSIYPTTLVTTEKDSVLVSSQEIPTVSIKIAISWSLFTEALIGRFGVPEEEDNRRLLKELKSCKKHPRESVCLHAAQCSSDHHSTPLDNDYVSNYKNNPDYNHLSQQQQ